MAKRVKSAPALPGADPVSAKGERTRERILDVALEVFAETGPAGARVNDIAERSGANKERIYAYFGNKDGLFTAVLARTFERLAARDAVLDDLGDDDLPTLIEILIDHMMRAHEAEPTLWRILAWENLGGGVHLEAVGSLASRGYGRVAELYALGQARGRFPAEVGFATFITTLIGVVYFYHSNRLTLERSLGQRLGGRAARRRFAAELARLLQAGAD